MRMATTAWITVSTIGCSSGVVQVFDSSHHLKLSHSLKCIIADILLQASKDSIVLEYIKMQQQSGASDCACMAFLLLRLPLQYAMGKIFVCWSLMRKHLLQCFQNGAMLPFPSKSIAARKPKVLKEEVVEIYCHCSSRIQEERWWGCQKWFHCDCLHACISMPHQEIH